MNDKPDTKAVEILFRKYWTGTRWTRAEERKISEGDYQYAVDQGVMFSPAVFAHDETIDRVLKSIRTVRKEAFAANITSERSKRPENAIYIDDTENTRRTIFKEESPNTRTPASSSGSPRRPTQTSGKV